MISTLKADWLDWPQTRAVMAALLAAQPDGARFVGGCVRNTIMARPVDDIDIATQLVPTETLAALAAAGIRAIATGIEHGTVTAIVDGRPFEITSLRRDVETDGRRAVVAFTQDWSEDAMRRDFRFNALYADVRGQVFDPAGGGLEDAASGRVVFIGDADARLREDFLRILRFFRFNAWYGAAIDPEGLAACTRRREGLRQIARERVWKELHKLLAAPRPGDAVTAMAQSGVLAIVLPDHGPLSGLRGLLRQETAHDVAADPMRRLMALLAREPGAATQAAAALRLSNAQALRLQAWADPGLVAPTGLVAADLRALAYWHGVEAVIDRALLGQGDAGDVVTRLAAWQRPRLPVNGADALAVGLSGPEVGAALGRVERHWAAHDFAPDRGALLALLVQGAQT